MYYLIFIIVVIIIIYGYFKIRFKKHWALVYTAFGDEEYFKTIERLDRQGIKYRTITSPTVNNNNRGMMSNQYKQYDIYVKKEDEHKAGSIHNN